MDQMCPFGKSIMVPHRSELREEFPELPNKLAERWCDKGGVKGNSTQGEAIASRYNRLTNRLQQRPERKIALITHHDVLLGLVGASFLPGELRVYSTIW